MAISYGMIAMPWNAEQRWKISLIAIACAVGMGIPAIDNAKEIMSWPGREYVANMNVADYNYLYPGDDLNSLCERGSQISFSENSELCAKHFRKNGTNIETEIMAQGKVTDGFAEVPLYRYPGYKAFCDGKEVTVSRGTNGVIRVPLPELVTGETVQLSIKYQEPVLWRIAELISLTGIMVSGFWVWKGKMKCQEMQTRSI